MCEEIIKCGVSDWYADRSVLVTGATGFMGKVLVEKLLRSCPDLKYIYVLIRSKKGVPPEERLEKEILNVELFDTLRDSNSEVLEKVIPIEGDILSPDLGLSEEDRETIIENVTVVFHSAATVKFDEVLKLSVAMNIIGTGFILNLCQKIKKLEAFVHVSTAYCNCHLQEIDEKLYPPPADLDKLLKYINDVDDDVINSFTYQIISDRPNTYTFTKSLAEHLLVEQGAGVPVAVLRPSIVTASWREPVPGWIDNLNGPTGLFLGAGKGVIRSLLCHTHMIADFIPVDKAIATMICVAWFTATHRPKEMQIYNCTSGSTNPVLWGEIQDYGRDALRAYPFSGMLWYPGGSFKSSTLFNKLCCFFFHTIPAHIVDTGLMLLGRKKMMLRVQRKFTKAMATFEYFTTKEWRFLSSNVYKIWGEMSQEDQQIFNFNMQEVNWREYVNNYHLGTRRYILKDRDDTLPQARKHLYRMKLVHHAVQALVLASVYYLFVYNSSIENIIFNVLSQIWDICTSIFT